MGNGTSKWHAIFAIITVIFLISALFLAQLFFLAPSAHSQTLDKDARSTIIIHKFEQPELLGARANGLPQDTSGLTAVPGARFSAKRVPGIDLSTNEGQGAAAVLDIKEASSRVANEPVAASAITNAQGDASLSNLEVGLYYVEETTIPLGFIGAAPFLVALPLTNPESNDSWLHTVHVYPKNFKASIVLDVKDEDAVTLGDVVNWSSKSSIPLRKDIDGYRVEQKIHKNLELVSNGGDYTSDIKVNFTGAGGQELVRGQDYLINYDSNSRTITVDFLEPGLKKLEAAVAADPTVEVQIDYGTKVRAEGILTNTAILYPSEESISQGVGVSSEAETRWGPLAVVVHEQGKPDNTLAGGKFQLFLTPEDAYNKTNPVVVNGISEWTTDENGRYIFKVLRFPGYVNGRDRDSTDPLFHTHWVAPVETPPGWIWVDPGPKEGLVKSDVIYESLEYEVYRVSDQTTPGGSNSWWALILLPFAWLPFIHSPDSSYSANTPDTTEVNPREQRALAQTPTTRTKIEEALASTGAQVTGVLLFGAVFTIAGILLLARRKDNKGEEN
ncbi:SpaH/EbpB family LPXTG-anchored major pilin [Corynebacterium callunae]|uniref:SpaH/EbpB family LPXTG-anchored major pilin n=1 Tax=Corynebacterium callunae TaxID=1721 RepID=UPI0039824B4C